VASQDKSSLAFVVRIWIEQTPGEVEGGLWRGHITSLPDQERGYVQSLTEIASFIDARLRELGLGPGAARTTR
jgi:hypothetical protein